MQRIQYSYTPEYFLLSSMCTLNIHIWYKHDKKLNSFTKPMIYMYTQILHNLFFRQNSIVQPLNLYTTLRQCKCTVQLITFPGLIHLLIGLIWTEFLSYDHLFNFNSYMCKITNDICAVHSPVFATILKADKWYVLFLDFLYFFTTK